VEAYETGWAPHRGDSVIPRINLRPSLTIDLVEKRVFAGEPFSLIDVGASGGIADYWKVFGNSLTALGFEPLIAEANRLNAAAPPNVRYEAAFVSSTDQQTEHGQKLNADRIRYRDNQPFPRTSAWRATSLQRLDYVRTYYDSSGSGALSTTTVTLDDVYRRAERRSIDFIKVDTDGHDYYVLRGAQRVLQDSPVLGLSIECQFHGPVHHHANLFSNIDRFLRGRGFSLFDLEVYRYSRATLPRPFVYTIPANTHQGQVLWGEALYVRDAGDPEYAQKWGVSLTPIQLSKLVCIFEMFGLEDCAAELLVTHRDRMRSLVDVDRCLDLLTPLHQGERLTFSQYDDRFEKHVDEWYPTPPAPSPPAQKALPVVHEKPRSSWLRKWLAPR
jgi:FkbM family methyltransferase